MKKQIITALTTSILLLGAHAAAAQVTDPAIPGHPRVNEVDQRLQNQQNRISAGVADGQLTAQQATKDEARDTKISQQLSADQAKNGGHITKAEQRRLNKKLNKNSKIIHKQRSNSAAAATAPATGQ